MNKRLKKLLEERDAAHKAYEDFLKPLIDAKRDLTDTEEARKAELRSEVDAFEERITEVNEEARREELLTEARKRAGITPDISVTHEARTYEEGSPNSYIADLVRGSNPMWPGHAEAMQRMARHGFEVSVEVARNTTEGKRARQMIRDSHRTENGQEARRALQLVEERGNAGAAGSELRAGMDTTAASGGAFATPVYMVGSYAPYREAGRAFIDQCNKMPLPAYGMTVYVPRITNQATVAAQVGQNQGIAETDPNAGYIAANLVTEAGEVTVSQQLLDRTGPDFQFDKMIFDQLERDYNPKVDQYALTVALANAGAVTYNGTFALSGISGVGPSFYSKVGAAKVAIRKGAGVFMNPTHLFMDPTRWELIEAWGDANGRPLVVPDYAGPFNAIAGGNATDTANYEGATGYRFKGLPAFQDANIPVPASGADQAIIGALNEVYVFEGTPVTRTIPQTYAPNLSVLLQLYSYITALVRYPGAVQTISGTAMATVVL